VLPLQTGKHFLIALKKSKIIHQIGFLNIFSIAGSLNIDGYTLPLKKRQSILTSDWMPARCVMAGNFDIKISTKTLQRVLKEILGIVQISAVDTSYGGMEESQIGSLFIAECHDPFSNEWMIAAEDCIAHAATKDDCYHSQQQGWRHCTELVVGRGLLATKEVMDFLKIDLFEIKPSWRMALGGLLGTLRTQSVDQLDVKVILCGAKGAGKSSALRCAVNRFLSVASQVCVIDCDLGQPEFSVPGLLSLHVVSEPILAPCHLNLRTPELSVFVGDVTPKNIPHIVEQAVKALYARYVKLSRDKKVSFRKNQSIKSSNQSSSSSSNTKNIFDAFTEDNDMNAAADRQMYILPLVVNTDGYTRYMGECILSSVLTTIQPTHICHVCTEKDMELPSVEQHVASRVGESSSSPSCQVYRLEPGSLSPGKASATDLRTLR
jgi:hypothetical protein